MALIRAAATVGGFTLLSRVLGFARDILIANFLGAGMLADAFFVAFKLPNFFRRLFAEGAFNAAFVPMFSGIARNQGGREAHQFAEQALAILLGILLAFVIVVQATMPWLMYGLAPGFADTPVKFDLAVALTRLTFPYLLFVSLISLMGGMLNAVGRFAAVAAAPILLNVCMIVGLLVLAPYAETAGHALAWSVAAAGIAQFVWLAAVLARAGLGLRLPRPRLTPRVRELGRLMLPGILGAGVVQINLLADVVIASFLPEGSISYLYYADRVNQLPLGVVGVAVGTVLLPQLSRLVAGGEAAAANASQNRAVELALLLALPAAAALVVLAAPVTTVLFARGAFGAEAASATALALMAYAAGIPAYVLIKVLTPGYFARRDTASPVRIALVCMAVNLALNLVVLWWFKHAAGLALATALAAWLNIALLSRGLGARGYLSADSRLRRRLPRMALAAVAMAAALWLGAEGLARPLGGGESERALALAALVVLGLAVFAGVGWLTGAVERRDFEGLMRRRRDAGAS